MNRFGFGMTHGLHVVSGRRYESQRICLGGIDMNLSVALDALLAERNLTRAAARVRITQSAMSHALARLRALIGDELLVREGREMIPTARGAELHMPVRQALA